MHGSQHSPIASPSSHALEEGQHRLKEHQASTAIELLSKAQSRGNRESARERAPSMAQRIATPLMTASPFKTPNPRPIGSYFTLYSIWYIWLSQDNLGRLLGRVTVTAGLPSGPVQALLGGLL